MELTGFEKVAQEGMTNTSNWYCLQFTRGSILEYTFKLLEVFFLFLRLKMMKTLKDLGKFKNNSSYTKKFDSKKDPIKATCNKKDLLTIFMFM